MSHDSSHPEPEPKPVPQPARPGGGDAGPAAIEDAGAQALAEALRSSFNLIKLVMVLLVGAFIASGLFTVKPNQVAVKLRFGRPVGVGREQLLQPGLHWKLPYPIDEVVYIPVGETHTLTSTAGWYAVTPEEEASGQTPSPLPYLRPGVDGYTLAGDGNIIHVRATMSYRISANDPLSYAFHFAQVTNLLQHVLDNALAYASARFNADDALYRDKLAFQELILGRVNALVDRVQLGITLDVREVRTSPPLDVEPAFNDVVKAQQQGDTKIREAEGYARGATNNAVGEASTIRQDALTRSNYFVKTVEKEASNFLGFLPSYQRSPELFTKRLLAETIERVLTNAQFKTYLPERADGRPRELRLLLNKELEAPRKTETPTAR
jgi:membrane protease subunit HflK